MNSQLGGLINGDKLFYSDNKEYRAAEFAKLLSVCGVELSKSKNDRLLSSKLNEVLVRFDPKDATRNRKNTMESVQKFPLT